MGARIQSGAQSLVHLRDGRTMGAFPSEGPCFSSPAFCCSSLLHPRLPLGPPPRWRRRPPRRTRKCSPRPSLSLSRAKSWMCPATPSWASGVKPTRPVAPCAWPPDLRQASSLQTGCSTSSCPNPTTQGGMARRVSPSTSVNTWPRPSRYRAWAPATAASTRCSFPCPQR